MTIERQALTPLFVVLSLLTALALVVPGALLAQSHQPPATPPAEWGAISINLEGFEYPHPVEFMNFSVYGQDPDLYSSGSINGDDTILLYLGAATGDGSNAGLVDLFGEDSVDGTGTVWEYTDSYAQRCGDTSSAVFDPLDWNIPGPNALEAGCGSDDACETANLQVLTDPWNHAGCSTSGPGTSYCIGDHGACPCGNDINGINGPAVCANEIGTAHV